MKFCRRDVKRDLIMASKWQTNPYIYVNESLTPTWKTIYDTLRKMKRKRTTLLKGGIRIHETDHLNTKYSRSKAPYHRGVAGGGDMVYLSPPTLKEGGT